MKTAFTLNGKSVSWELDQGTSLRDALRAKGIVSVRNGCDGEGSCGLCAVLLDGASVNSCQILAVQVQGREVRTVDGLAKDRELSIVQRALVDAACVQCGYCTPAVALAIHELLGRDRNPGRGGHSRRPLRHHVQVHRLRAVLQRGPHRRKAPVRPGYGEAAAPEFRPDLRHIGKDREKVDAARLALGERAFVEDRVDADACHLKMLTSPHAHAWIKSIDASAAEAMPGVVAVLTHLNCPDQVYTTAGQGYPEPSPYDQRMFSKKVRHVGDRVAAVLAESPDEAQAALEAIRVDYDVLEPVLSIAQARVAGAPVIHSGAVSYVAGEPPPGTETAGDGRDDPIIYQFPLGSDPHRNLAASAADGIGDVEAGFAEADMVIERSYKANRVQCTPMEPHVVYARIDSGRLVLRASTQVPWHVRRIVARAIGISENKVRVIKERVGGGFGAKQDIVVEDVAGYLAWKSGRPVFFRYDREQEFIASRTRHAMEIRVKLGAKSDGRLTAILIRLDADTGPYGQHCLTVPMNAISKSLPLLLCDNARFEVKLLLHEPLAGRRLPGLWSAQRLLRAADLPRRARRRARHRPARDDRAQPRALGHAHRDPAQPGRGPRRSGRHPRRMRPRRDDRARQGGLRLKEQAPSERPRHCRRLRDKEQAPSQGDWKTGRGAVIIQQGSGLPGLDAANAEVRLLADGTLLMLSGGADLGTGLDTVTAKTAAEILGLDMEDVEVVSGDTDETPFDKGAYASSGTYFSGNAALRAAEDLRDKALAVAAAMLGEDTPSSQDRASRPHRRREGRSQPRQARPHVHPGRGPPRARRLRQLQDRARGLPLRRPLRQGRGQRTDG